MYHGEKLNIADSNSGVTRGDDEDDDADNFFMAVAVPGRAPGAKPKETTRVRTHQPIEIDPIDLTIFDENPSNGLSEPGIHSPTTKFLDRARRDYPNKRPPFVRLNRGKALLGPRRVNLATADGQVSFSATATLEIRAWDSKSSYYTIDRDNERLIVKPVGGRYINAIRVGTQYRAWSGQGNRYEIVPVAFELKRDAEQGDSNGKDRDDHVKSSHEDVVSHDSDSTEEYWIYSSNSEGSSFNTEEQQDSDLRDTSIEPDPPEPLATRDHLTDIDTSHDQEAVRGPTDVLSDRIGPTSRTISPPLDFSPEEASTVMPKISEVAAEKRSATDIPEGARSPRRVRTKQVEANIHSTTVAIIPPSLTLYKQERTVLYVPLRGSSSDLVPIKLRSAMSIPSFFTAVCTAGRIADNESLAIAVKFMPGDDGQSRNVILGRDTIDAFEFFLEVVDEAECWKQEDGRMSFQLEFIYY